MKSVVFWGFNAILAWGLGLFIQFQRGEVDLAEHIFAMGGLTFAPLLLAAYVLTQDRKCASRSGKLQPQARWLQWLGHGAPHKAPAKSTVRGRGFLWLGLVVGLALTGAAFVGVLRVSHVASTSMTDGTGICGGMAGSC